MIHIHANINDEEITKNKQEKKKNKKKKGQIRLVHDMFFLLYLIFK